MTADLGRLLINLATAFPVATELVTILIAIVGLIITGRALGDAYAMAISPGRREVTWLGVVGKLLIGGAMVVMPFLLWKSGNTFVLGGTGETTIFAYTKPDVGSSTYCQGLNAVVVLFFFFIGVTAIHRGFMVSYQATAGHRRGMGEAWVFFIAGTVCFFIVDATTVVGNTFGLKVGIDNICQMLDDPGEQQ